MATKIQVNHVSKIFGPHAKSILSKVKEGKAKDEILKETGHTVGVNDVSFDVNEGEIFVIMGLSGSGKSTLIRCLNLLNRPTAGEILVDGENIVAFDKKRLKAFRQQKLAMVFQHFGLFSHRSVAANVEYGLEIRGVDKETRREKALEMLKTVGLQGWEDKLPSELSGGMQQRVGLARALANDPDILLMDEPFSALDPLIRREMQLELLDLQSKLKKTIVFITHDVNEAFKLGDRVAVMKDGEVVQIGTPEDILSNPANEYISDFVQDIDRTKVLQAKHIMRKPTTTIHASAGPKVAVKEMEADGLSSIFVVDADRKLLGLVTVDDAVKAAKEKRPLTEIVRKEFHTTDPETYIQDLIDLAVESKYPIAVVDDDEKFVGIIVRVSVLSGLM
ncbi:MAG TPA: glycine betaine/L-proline ABC transporter ATP-binding protein [Bacillales bacterium]|nr:glycine betaine/L-proline ABC transporter ATP-binding protein [Bacillales bacterium]